MIQSMFSTNWKLIGSPPTAIWKVSEAGFEPPVIPVKNRESGSTDRMTGAT